ncbi:MAG: hypothetical protein PHD76_06625 [Methylacidiphilales bacterium]|nr:hypothetical protein [Candidatus Methylacidiphilales bacterium]
MNFESFEKELQKLDSASGKEESNDSLAGLRSKLRQSASADSRSDQHQAWAWTRLREQLHNPERAQTSMWPWLTWKWLLPAAGAAALGLTLWWMNSDDSSDLTPLDSNIYASSFHMKNAAADVLWVEGYDSTAGSLP